MIAFYFMKTSKLLALVSTFVRTALVAVGAAPRHRSRQDDQSVFILGELEVGDGGLFITPCLLS